MNSNTSSPSGPSVSLPQEHSQKTTLINGSSDSLLSPLEHLSLHRPSTTPPSSALSTLPEAAEEQDSDSTYPATAPPPQPLHSLTQARTENALSSEDEQAAVKTASSLQRPSSISQNSTPARSPVLRSAPTSRAAQNNFRDSPQPSAATVGMTPPRRRASHPVQPELADPHQRPHPHPLRPSLSSFRGRAGHNSRSQLMTEIPLSADYYSPAGPSSVSPSSWSIASSDTPPSSGNSSMFESKIRFEHLANGSHRHNLSAPKRQQFLANQVRRLRELLDGKRDRGEDHVPTHPSHLHGSPVASPAAATPPHSHQLMHSSQGPHQLKPEVFAHPLSLLNEKYQDLDVDQTGSPVSSNRRRQTLKTDFVQKYGDLQQIVGKGAFGTVRLSIKRNLETGEEQVYAIKEFKYAHGESQKLYMRRLTSEFCIASSLKHMNVIQTMDLLQLHGDTYSEVMEYCAGGDMHSLIASASTLGESESNCFFSQLIHGVGFLHSMGVVHRDLKPENLLLTSDGCLKIADFGNSEVFRMPWEKKVRSSASIRGTGPFIAPEEFTSETFDARKVDMWACGIIYMCMRLGRYTWHEASDGDPIWDGFLYKRERLLEINELSHHSEAHFGSSHINLTALEQVSHVTLAWPSHILDVIENLLEPDTRKRWQVTHVLDSDWIKRIDNCHPTARPPDQILDESDFESAVLSQRVGSKVIPENASVTGCKIVKEVRDRRTTMAGTLEDEESIASPVA